MDTFKVENIHKFFGNLKVLKGISLHIAGDEVLTILGPSDSRKSILLRCTTFLDYTDLGHIEYFGQTTLTKENGVKTSKGDEKRFRRDYGLVFQSLNLLLHWTVMRNLCDALIKVWKRPPGEVRAEAKHLLERVNLPDKGEVCPSELSSDQKQRVAIVRALALRPRMLYFGEPTSALDLELTGEILAIIRSPAEEQTTTAIVIHEMELAAGVANRAMFTNGGTMLEEGVADELIHRPTQGRTKQFLSRLHGEVHSH